MEPQVFRLLVFLIENRDRVVSKDQIIETVWEGRIVSDATLNTRINAARRAVGDNGKDQLVIHTIPRRGFRFVADLTEAGGTSSSKAQIDGVRSANSAARASQTIRFCTTPDNVRIAYANAGSGPPLVKAANWLNHLEFDWDSPVWRHVFAAFAAENLLIRYDARGNGLSDWDVEDLSFDAFVSDLEQVVDTVGLKEFPLLAMSQGCSVSIAYAVRHPERVTKLILYGGYARGNAMRGEGETDEHIAMRTLIRAQWGTDNPAMRQLFTARFIPGGTLEQIRWFNDLQRMTTTPENAARLRETIDFIDIDELLLQVQCPTLVLHCRDNAVSPSEEGRRMAAKIPDARFVALEGQSHLIMEDEPAWPIILEEVSAFLKD